MKKTLTGMFLLFAFQWGLAGNAVTWLQYFYAIKQIFPNETQVAVLIPKDVLSAEQKALSRAAAINKLKVKLFPVSDTRDIGSHIKLMEDNSILIVYDAPLFMEKSSMLYILSRANDKNLTVVSESEAYGAAGAFLTLSKQDSKLKIVVNLKFKPELAAKFTPEFQQKLGICEVLQ